MIDFGVVTLIDLSVSLVGVLIALPAALTLAALQLKQTPGTVWLVLTLAALAAAMEAWALIRRGETRRLPKALLMYGLLPILPVLLVWLAAGHELPMWVGIALTCAITLPISPLLYRVAFRRKIYSSLEQLQADLEVWLREYNEVRPHQGKWCYGKTPLQTFRDALPLAVEKLLPDEARALGQP